MADERDGAGPAVQVRSLDTPAGAARAHVSAGGERGLVVLGHGAGGGVDAADLLAVTAALAAAGWSVARVEQPYRVRGRRAPEPAARLDLAWTAAVGLLRADPALAAGRLVTGGRSSGARVACRTAAAVRADAVVCLAFPLDPPRRAPDRPAASRAGELAAVAVPLLVVQGDQDPFGGPAAFPAGPTVVAVPGDHSLRHTAPVAEAVSRWLDQRET